MRVVLIALVGLLIALPAAAQNTAYRGQCRKLARQMDRYERDLGWAQERGNPRWEQANRQQLSRLAARRTKLCPDYAQDENAARQLAELLGDAAKLAARYFMMNP